MTKLDIFSEKKLSSHLSFADQPQKGTKDSTQVFPLTTLLQVRTAFITRFSDDRDKFRHKVTAENCVRGKEELVKNFYHKVKQAVDKNWPIEAAANQRGEMVNKT